MILLVEHRTVILTPPKCGSVSLYDALRMPPWNGLMVVQQHHGVLDKHGMELPNEALDSRVLLVIRNPYDRLVSLWHHFCRIETYHGRGCLPFDAWVGRMLDGKLGWMESTSIVDLVGSTKYDTLLSCELLEDRLKGCGIEAQLPRLNRSYRKNWRGYYSVLLMDTVRKWVTPDCETFNYQIF